MLRRATLEMLVVATLAVAPGGVSHAQLFLLYDWTSAAGGNYASQFNWNPIGVPDSSSEIARFQLNAIYSVLVPANYTVGSLAAREQGNVTLNLQGTTYTTGQLSVDPTVGGIVSLALTAGIVSVSGNTYVGRNASSGKANLILASASLTTVDALVGEGANSAGHVTIGQTSNWTAGGPVILGGAGDAQLDINAGFVTTCLGMNCNSAPTRGTATHARVVMAQRGQSTAMSFELQSLRMSGTTSW